ncbi:MAG: class I SAM-dependent methyltransferase [Chloroflexi bacterium]|nr:class I SAM-dependent methyltransferase [Chloroflexota bacterium]
MFVYGWRGKLIKEDEASGHQLISPWMVTPQMATAWQRPEIPSRQALVVDSELAALRTGQPPRVYQVAAEAVRAAGYAGERVVELGCASGYYSEALERLLGRPVDYLGLDYSEPLLRQGRRRYPHRPFLLGDTCALPLRDGAAPIVISGCVLLHVPRYADAIRETARVSSQWAIFHKTPVVKDGPTLTFRKLAYGVPVVEYVFGERHLLELFAGCGLTVEAAYPIGPYALPGVDRAASVVTYLCRRSPCGS